ncbi:MAG: hypothetical protein KDK69_03350, partial [Chlamydiia bacterium]|nr:hypothetical protein [Chlamydiia bacterium]
MHASYRAGKKQLKILLEKHQGLYRDFLLLLKKEHRALNLSAKIEDREVIFQPQEETISSITTDILTGLTFFLGSVTLFPKLGDTLKSIYARLLAIQWLKEDQRQLKQELGENVPPLKIPFTPNFPVIIDGTRYVICPTSPDGACALHALLGEKIDGEYRFRGDVRKHFIDTLKAKRQDPQVQSLFKRILKNHLHNAIDGRDLSSQMLFPDTPEGFQDAYYLLCSPFPLAIQLINAREAHLWAGEIDHNAFIREKLIQIAQQRREFSGKNSPEIVAKLKEDPFLLLNLIHPERTDFLNLLRHPAKRHFLALLALEKEQVLASQSKKQDDFVLSDQIFERYLETVNQETFFFNTEEIELAAYLFGKKVQILAVNGRSLQFSEYLFNPDLPEETTYIFHSSNHFSRCIPSNEISLAELNSLYNQAKGAAVVQRNKDERAEEILISTVKQELPRLGISYGVSWIIGPAPLISQSINSAVTITSTYLDPFKESPLSAVTQVSASPILQLATGNSYAYVATSLSVDLGGRMFFDSLEERDLPEGFQRYALAAAKGFILRDEDLLLSGLFTSTVSLGMDQFRNRWESYFELDEAYWAADPAWGHCIVKGLWTTHCLQESLGSWLKQTADAFIKEDQPPVPRVFEISYSEGGTHLLTPLGEKTWSYEVRETWDTEHNSWTGKDKKINERLSIFHIQKDASGNSIETKLDSVPNQAIGLAMIKLHEQAWNSYADFHEAASAFQQTLIDMGIPPGAIPPIQGLTKVHISIDFPSGSGKAKSYVTTVAGTTTWEIEEKHKGNRPLKILEIHGVDPNKTHNQTTLKEYISQLKNLFGLEITTAPSHPLSLYSPFVEQEGKTYHVTGIGEHGEVLKLSKTTDSEEATVMSNRLVTFNAKVIEQNKQCMEMEQRLIDAGIPETSRPTFPQLETKPHKVGDFEVSYAQINASNIRNTQATTNYISQGNKLLDTPFEPQSLTPQEKQALIDSFSPHIPPEPTPLGFWGTVAQGVNNVSSFLTDIGVESAQVSTSIPLYSAPKTSSPTFSENQIDLALSGGT